MADIAQPIILLILNIIIFYAGGIIASMAKQELTQYKKYISFMLLFLQVVTFFLLFQEYLVYAVIFSAATIFLWYFKKTFSVTLALSAITLVTGSINSKAMVLVVLIVQGIHDYELIMSQKTKKKQIKKEKMLKEKIWVIKKYSLRALMLLIFSVVFFLSYYFVAN